MKRALMSLAAALLVLVAGTAVAGPARAAAGVTIGTISTKTAPYAGSVIVTPVVSKSLGVVYVSRLLTVTRSGLPVATGVPSVALKTGNYVVTTVVAYQVWTSGKYGPTQTKSGSQLLTVKEAAPPRVTNTISAWPSTTIPCGSTVILKSDGTPWKCTFADEFTGSAVNPAKWTAQQTDGNGLHGGIECLVNSPNNIKVSSGLLHLTVRKEAAPFTCNNPHGAYTTQYTGGGISTWSKFAQTYGRFEFRAKFPTSTVPGLQSSLWLYPRTMTYGDWPRSGEIDVAESYSLYADRAIPYLHYTTGPVPDPGLTGITNWFCKLAPGAFHTYTAEWSPTTITIKYDGTTCLVHTIDAASPLSGSQPFDKPFAVILTQVLGGGLTNLFDPAQTPLPATMDVDYVRVWS